MFKKFIISAIAMFSVISTANANSITEDEKLRNASDSAIMYYTKKATKDLPRQIRDLRIEDELVKFENRRRGGMEAKKARKAAIYGTGTNAINGEFSNLQKHYKDLKWLQRTEFQLGYIDEKIFDIQLLTVQPLYQSKGEIDTVFTQLSFTQRQDENDIAEALEMQTRSTINAGIGYRRLLANNTVLLGINTFYDYVFDWGHQRYSIGTEARWGGFDLYANYYDASNDKKTGGIEGNIIETSLDGYDVELNAQIPYLPWARVKAKYYVWETQIEDQQDDKGYTTSGEFDIYPNFRVEAGMDNHYTNVESLGQEYFFAKATFSLAKNERRVTMLGNKYGMVSKKAFPIKNMKRYTLDKVERNNTVVVERSGAMVMIAVSRGS